MAKILLVEDDNNLREIYEARLQAEGYTIVSAQDGEEALVVAKKEKPDLVISDVMMPRISGFEMLDILRNTDGLQAVKVIMLTALGQAEDKTRADSLGADRYLVKSQVTLEDIVKAAQELLNDAGVGPANAAAAIPVPPVSTPSAEPTQPATIGTSVPSQPIPASTSNLAPTPPPADPVANAPSPQPAALANQPSSSPQQPEQVSSEAQAISTEEKAIKAQIEGYMAGNSQQSPEITPPVIVPPAVSGDEVMAKAVEELGVGTDNNPVTQAAPTPAPANNDGVTTMPAPSIVTPSAQPEVMPPPPKPDTDDEDDGVTVAHKKVIRPLSEPVATKPNINELLAKEGLDDFHVSVNGSQNPPEATLPTSPHPPGHVIAPNPQTGKQAGQTGNIDPSSISL